MEIRSAATPRRQVALGGQVQWSTPAPPETAGLALDFDPTTVSGLRWLHVPPGSDPFRRPSPPGDNRWQRGLLVDDPRSTIRDRSPFGFRDGA